MAKTGPSDPNSDLLPCILPKLKLWEPVELVEKNYEILIEFPLQKVGTLKRNLLEDSWKASRLEATSTT